MSLMTNPFSKTVAPSTPRSDKRQVPKHRAKTARHHRQTSTGGIVYFSTRRSCVASWRGATVPLLNVERGAHTVAAAALSRYPDTSDKQIFRSPGSGCKRRAPFHCIFCTVPY